MTSENFCNRPSDFYDDAAAEVSSESLEEAQWNQYQNWLLDELTERAEAYEQRCQEPQAIDARIPFPELLDVAQQVKLPIQETAPQPRPASDAA